MLSWIKLSVCSPGKHELKKKEKTQTLGWKKEMIKATGNFMYIYLYLWIEQSMTSFDVCNPSPTEGEKHRWDSMGEAVARIRKKENIILMDFLQSIKC